MIDAMNDMKTTSVRHVKWEATGRLRQYLVATTVRYRQYSRSSKYDSVGKTKTKHISVGLKVQM